jgi:hypothetical protein
LHKLRIFEWENDVNVESERMRKEAVKIQPHHLLGGTQKNNGNLRYDGRQPRLSENEQRKLRRKDWRHLYRSPDRENYVPIPDWALTEYCTVVDGSIIASGGSH